MNGRVLSSLPAALCLATAPAAARAQAIPAACRSVIDAERKEIMTPYHEYLTEGTPGAGDKAATNEAISAGGVNYIMVHGQWRRSPLTPKDALDRIQENLSTAKAYSCRHVGDESVNGVSAAVYTSHSENEGVIGDSRTWIAKGSGLPVRQEEDITTGGTDKRHMSIRWEYTNVQAPAGVR